jgi:biopolymer transport protein ExbD
VTIDRAGKLFFNREPVTLGQLDQRLHELAADPDHPTLYLAVEAEGDVDRGPMLVKLLERVHKSGITNFAIVGPPESDNGPEGADTDGGSVQE